MKNNFIIFLCGFILYSCGLPYCHKVQLTNEDLRWLSPYEEKDTFFYTSSSEEITDTLIITEKKILNPRNTFPFDTEGCNWMEGDNEFHGIGYISMRLRHNGKDFEIYYDIRRESKDGELLGNFIFAERSWGHFPGNEIHIVDFETSHKRYKKCLVFDENNMDLIKNYSDSICLKKIVWSRDSGLLLYILNECDTFCIRHIPVLGDM